MNRHPAGCAPPGGAIRRRGRADQLAFFLSAFFAADFFVAFLAAVFFAGLSSLLSPRAALAESTERCSAASRSTTSPELLVEVGVRLTSPPSILFLTSS